MVSIIKNQLLKHLSRYTKNLSSDKINVSTFRGEGDLSNLQLDENVLTDLLELPSWIRLTSAWCNHVSFRISWTKLKSVPITLTLDEVNITVETCEVNQRIAINSGVAGWQSLTAPQGKYTFINKIIDGITVIVNTVNINFKSSVFTASVQMSRIRVESKTPKWLNGDLHLTRLKDTVKGHLLIFKELSWQTVRIEASSTQDTNMTPLRLLTNQARCRITVKKRLTDCAILASRLVLILDDLLWVLTDSQLNAALHFADSLASLIKESTNLMQKTKAKKFLEQLAEYKTQAEQQQYRGASGELLSKPQRSFNLFDVKETSYHFFSQRIDLHLCDDAGNGRSCYPDLSDGGALQISVHGFQIDYYPFHLAISNRTHWPKYKEASSPPALWLDQSLNSFREALLDLYQPSRTANHAPLERTTNQTYPNSGSAANATEANQTRLILENFNKLMTSCVLLRIENFTLYRVSTSGKKQMPKEFICGDKNRYSFPAELSTLHAEFTYFYFPEDYEFPLPSSKLFIHLNPIQINFHLESILWLNSFALNLHKNFQRTSLNAATFEENSNRNEPNIMYMDVKVEAIMMRIIVESSFEVTNQRDRPKQMQAQISRMSMTNIRETGSSRADLANALHSLQEGSLIFAAGFPSKKDDLSVVTDRILSHVSAADVVSNRTTPTPANFSTSSPTLLKHVLWIEPRDVWCIKLDPVWVDFLGARSVGTNKAVPFVDAVPITLWIHGRSTFSEEISSKLDEKSGTDNPLADLHVIGHVSNLVSIQIDHFQYLFLLRIAEEITELTAFMTIDSKRILEQQIEKKSIIIGCVIPQLEVTLVMPSQTPGKESNGGDGESTSYGVDEPNPSIGTLNGSNNWHANMSLSLEQGKTFQSTTFGSIETPSPVMTEKPVSACCIEEEKLNVSSTSAEYSQSSVVFVSSNNATPVQKSKNRNSVTEAGLKEIGSSLSSMKKGFSNFMTSIDSALKNNPNDDLSDTISIQSDMSSDSDNFMMVMGDDKTTDCMDMMFKLNPFLTDDSTTKAAVVEVASEVCEEPDFKTNRSSPSNPSESSTWKRRDLVSVVTFRLTTVEIVKESQGEASSIRMQIAALSASECGAIPWDELQTKFEARCRAWNMAPYNQESMPRIQLRLDDNFIVPYQIDEHFVCPDKKDLLSWFKRKLDVHVDDFSLDLSMSTVIGLNDLIEDEILPKPLPADILLNGVKLRLIEDRPSVNITSPGPVPIEMEIGKMHIHRNESGVFEIQPLDEDLLKCDSLAPKKERDRETKTLQLVLQQLKLDNDCLKMKLMSAEKSSELNAEKMHQESETLRSFLRKAQDDISNLLDEKRKLLETVQHLQNQIMSNLNMKNDSNR